MNIGQIVKISTPKQYTDIQKDTLAIITNIDKNTNIVYTITALGKTYRDYEKGFSATRNIDPNIRMLFEKIFEAEKEKQKLKKQIDELQTKIDKINEKEKITADKLVVTYSKSQGNLTTDQVSELCKKKFAYLFEYGYEMETYRNTVRFYYHKDIQKWFRKASFLYEEYDGTIGWTSDYKENKEYKQILNKYSHKVGLCKLPFEERLSLEDKDWLVYNACYTLEFKDLKKETVKKILAKY